MATQLQSYERKEEQHIARLLSEPPYANIVKRVSMASRGKVYLIGGFLYVNLSNFLVGGNAQANDTDFCVDGAIDRPKVRSLFALMEQNTRFDALKVNHNGLRVDLFELSTYDDARGNGSPPSLEKYVSV